MIKSKSVYKVISFSLITAIILSSIALQSCQQKEKESGADQQTSAAFEHADWSKDDVIYEVNIRQFTSEGTFDAFREQLPRLQKMGVDIIWLMPIHPIGLKNRKGELGSYYSVKDYKDINPEFGNKEDFRELVEEVHQLDMHIIIDWVANHTSWDNSWMDEHPEWYKKDSAGNFVSPFDWSDVVGLDYTNDSLRKYMKNAMIYWVKDENIDGFRCDVAGMVPVDFWNEVRVSLNEIKPVFMLAEAEEVEHHIKAFDMSYAWEMHHVMNKIAAGEMNANNIDSTLQKNSQRFPEWAYRMQFTSNHDENSWNGTVFERLGDGVKTFAALTYVIPGMPLIYNGQESAMDKRLEFFVKDSIPWDHYQYQDFYTRLNQLKEDNQALWNGNFGGSYSRINTNDNEKVFALVRQKDQNKVVGIFNLSDNPVQVNFSDENLSGNYTELFSGESKRIEGKTVFDLDGWEYLIFYN